MKYENSSQLSNMAESASDDNSLQLVELCDKAFQHWTKQYVEGKLQISDFRSYWKDVIPAIFCPDPSSENFLNLTFDEDKAKQLLIDPLEAFICNGIPSEVFQSLKSLENPPVLCGKVFKLGEPTYSCRDCGADPTCVLCVDCFKTSAHRNHRYKICTSGGGGYCDCGDKEAWKTDAFCEQHKEDNNRPTSENAISKYPEDVIRRGRLVFSAVVGYCYQLLVWEKSQLPQDLSLNETELDKYCTVLFNDEIHTYDQVIKTLEKAINCNQRVAIDYATAVDREGRSLVKCSNFILCSNTKLMIEKSTSRHGEKPLLVTVMHSYVIAHQIFAMKLLTWFLKLMDLVECFRLLFSEAMLKINEAEDCSMLESIMRSDSQLWKAARNQWHQLFISGMLMEQDTKKAFAKVFTKNYHTLLSDFISDDHDHSLSVTSMSVQIFTVPTLAHVLIAEEDVLSVLMKTFLMECEHKLNNEKRLSFEKNQNSMPFKRAQYILFDLRYLLTSKPEEWTDILRRNFMNGFHHILTLLSWMQGMDSVVRQVGQHMEFEPEWESAFNLYIRFSHVLPLVLEWCGSDRILLIKAFRAALRKMDEVQGQMSIIGRELADHAASCIEYDVSSQPVSIHLPLSRLLAGLHLYLDKYNLTYDSQEFFLKNKPTPVKLMEFPLRAQVMIAQVHAGMWRRNGYALINQIFFYNNVRCRSDMLDKDIIMLQTAGALIESNEFLIHILNKFGLMNWAREDYESDYLKLEEDSIRQTVSLVEEFLGLLIVILSERYTPGVGNITEKERVKKEVIQQLCMEPLSHSQLQKALPEDANHETGLENIIEDIATFKKPLANAKGVYELKQDFYKDYNLFFYHYSREEQSRAEEVQRKRRKQANEDECIPPARPPPLCQSYSMLVNILQCDVMLHVIRIILQRAANLRARSFSEAQVHKVLHLIGLALYEEQRYHENNDPFFSFTDKAEKRGILTHLEALVNSARITSHQDFINWSIKTFKQVQKLKDSSSTSPENVLEESAEENLAKLQKEEKNRRAEIAAARRSRLMAQMSLMQKKFAKEHAEMLKDDSEEPSPTISQFGSAMDISTPNDPDTVNVCIGRQQTKPSQTVSKQTCMLCQEEQEVSPALKAMVLTGFIQRSSVLSKNRGKLIENPDTYDPLLMPSDLHCGSHTGSCGHVMHAECWQKYFDSILAKERHRPARFRHTLSYDIDKLEFLCPLCECLSNTVIPINTTLVQPSSLPESENDVTVEEMLKLLEISFQLGLQESEFMQTEEASAGESSTPTPKEGIEGVKTADIIKQLPDGERIVGQVCGDIRDGLSLSTSLQNIIQAFSLSCYTVGLSIDPNQDNERVPLMVWRNCAYTLHTTDALLACQDKPLFGDLPTRQADCLNALCRLAGLCAGACNPAVIRKHCHRLLGFLLHVTFDCPSVLEVDLLSTLIMLSASLPYLYHCDSAKVYLPPTGSIRDHLLFQIALAAHILQILLSAEPSLFEPDGERKNSRHQEMECQSSGDFIHRDDTEGMDLDDSSESQEEEKVYQLYVECRRALRQPTADLKVSPKKLIRYLQSNCEGFLRACSIFFHNVTDITPNKELCQFTTQNFETLCLYLGLQPSFLSLLNSQAVQTLWNRWLSHPNLVSASTQIRFPLSETQLVSLPNDYSELINSVSRFTCPNSDGDESRTPTMCLVCGSILCSQSYCCQTDLNGVLFGACMYHTHFCGADVGIFLRVRECKIMLSFSKSKGCFIPSPYLDQYGEPDQGLRRGNPLHICQEQYKKLHKLWLSHSIPEEIAHALEMSNALLPTDWRHY